ncbi:MAG TPA: hypothetical protein VNV87_18470 [Acidimicrobiales bacterium]|nr:hypothetical protein [Acidimicrobiales bacterium]
MPETPDGGEARGSLPLAVTASLVGGYRWIEQRLFELLGGWAAEATSAELRMHLDAQSARHAWHASLWADRLPVRDGVSADELTVAAAAAARVLAVLDGSRSEPAPLMAGLYRVVLPRLVTGYTLHLGATAPVSDAPVIRALHLVLTDEIEDWHAGERLVQGLLTRPDDVAAVSALHLKLESALVEAGTGTGLTGWPV